MYVMFVLVQEGQEVLWRCENCPVFAFENLRTRRICLDYVVNLGSIMKFDCLFLYYSEVNSFILFPLSLCSSALNWANATLLMLNSVDLTRIFFVNTFISYTNYSTLYSLKFTSSILFLVFIRAGLPRYRYDYLTILGWSKFLVFTLFIFCWVFLMYLFI